MVAEPKCPACSVQGIQYITSSESAERSKGGDVRFYIAHCTECGHVYGVFTKAAHGASVNLSQFSSRP
jgi:uncharacterized Zn finger protein